MTMSEKLKDAYYWAEDRYYGILDSVDERTGISPYWLVSPVEDAGIPTLPIAVGLLIILVSLVGYMLAGSPLAPEQKASITVQVTVNGQLIPDYTVIVTAYDSGRKEMVTKSTSDGVAVLKLPRGEEATIVATRRNCEDAVGLLNYARDVTITLDMDCPV
jgi:hypothetical protein